MGGNEYENLEKAFESGNLLGQGPGDGFVKLTLPDVHTDFIFAVWAVFTISQEKKILNAMK